MRDYDALRTMLNKEIDDDLADRIKRGMQVEAAMNSRNPSARWSKYQGWAMAERGTVQSNLRAIEIYMMLLLPVAEEALKDQLKGLQGKVCDWPPNPYAAAWYQWCVINLTNLQNIMSANAYNFAGYTAWYAGEMATAMVENRIPMKLLGYEDGQPKYQYWRDLPEEQKIVFRLSDEALPE